MIIDRPGASDRRHGDRDTSRSIGHDVVMPADGKRVPFDPEEYVERTRTNSCFVCRLASDSHGEHVVYRDDHHIAFLPRFHVQLGYLLVAPLEHREAVANDFTTDEYLAVQAVVHRIAKALASVAPTERIYVASLGSRQGAARCRSTRGDQSMSVVIRNRRSVWSYSLGGTRSAVKFVDRRW